MMLMGADQQLQVRYWPPQIATQFSETKPFKWKVDVWYRMKFRVAVEGDKATIQGKVWPRDEKEPDAWTVETTDDQPNTHGSPVWRVTPATTAKHTMIISRCIRTLIPDRNES